ncbi:MAG TPA: transglutaminaseTgpA domain-containing protein [Thermoanaerobaculia bacterium]|nr:transglutaminaseTgpA domain-containing protein [Thermoanaerobaculia bacterium]
MTRRARELEMLLLTMFAAVPLYFTYAIAGTALILFHAFTGLMALRVLLGRTPELIPASIMRWVAIAYVPFYIIDWMISRSAIAASTHLVLFIAAYQPIESVHRQNHAQRLLTTALIFIASIATSTHITIIPFIVVFAYFVFRQLMHVSHEETARSIGHEYGEAPAGRAAGFYLAGAIVIGTLLFPLLPRLRNPLVRGLSGPLAQSATALSETINFNDRRAAQGDATVVARVWMSDEMRARFTPLRLRGMIYDHYENGEWKQSLRGLRQVPQRGPQFSTGTAGGHEGPAVVEMRPQRGKVFLPPNTYLLQGPQTLYEGPARETYYTYDDGPLRFEVRMSTETAPLRPSRPRAQSGYPISPAVETLARTIVGNEQDPARKAALIEQYMIRNFRYVPNDQAAEPITLERFLLFERGGHCEYFAAGMVALLNATGVQARIAGGFYGGQINPLTGYYAVRREDAHAWTEVWTGTRWMTFDGTPPTQRPGATQENPLRLYAAALSDSLTFFWDRYVLTFGLGDQISLFEDIATWSGETIATLTDRLRSGSRTIPMGNAAMVLGAIAGAVAMVLLFRRRRRRLFDVIASYLAAQGIAVGPAMTMEEALRQLPPEAAEELAPLIVMYEQETFGATPDRRRARTLKRKLAELRT